MMMQQEEKEEEEEDDDTSMVLRSSGPQQQRRLCWGWQRFLRKNTIRVLLVETDDSTRQVVTALLHHCMYQVIPVENGRQAWTYLEDMQNSIDLVLTEVVMPALSGVSLLSRIVNHNTRKNIPVIMMSSNDAMGTVFKCLSKGAVDFLVKPIRKNELKNLWQHVWRRCHSSSARGCESGIQMQNCSKPKNVDEYENNSGSNDDDDASTGLDARDDSDNGSGTQAESSWTKRAVASDSPQAMSRDQLAAPPDSNCAQEIYPKSEMCSNRWLPGTNNRNCKKQKETNDHFKGKDLVIGAPRNFNTYYQSSPGERPMKPTDRRCEYSPHNNLKEAMMENLEEPIVHAADLIGSMAKNLDAQQAAKAADAPNFSSKLPEGKDKNHDNILPSLELSLKRTRPTGDGTNVIQDEQRNVLIRSDLSAFTRYHTTVASNQGGTAFVGSCSPRDNSSEAMKTDSTCNMKSNSDAAPTKQSPNGSTNNNDMGSTSKKTVTESTTKEIVMPPSAIKAASGHTSAFHPVQVQQRTPPANATGKEKADEVAAKMARRGEVQSNLLQHSRAMLHYVHLDVEHENNGGSGVFDPQSGSSNAFDPPAEGHAADYGVNGSNSGSNNGSTTAVNAEGPSKEVGDGAISKSELNGSGHDMYLKRFTQREHRMAAVIKFRQKRKERNFGKKVRYQSRKRLAEQRPRVRGQFVRQSVQDEEEENKKAAR